MSATHTQTAQPQSTTHELLSTLTNMEATLHSMWGVMVANQHHVTVLSKRLERLETVVGGVLGEQPQARSRVQPEDVLVLSTPKSEGAQPPPQPTEPTTPPTTTPPTATPPTTSSETTQTKQAQQQQHQQQPIQAPEHTFQYGDRVVLQNLKNDTTYNGKRAKVVPPNFGQKDTNEQNDENSNSGFVAVLLEATNELLWVPPKNLLHFEAPQSQEGENVSNGKSALAKSQNENLPLQEAEQAKSTEQASGSMTLSHDPISESELEQALSEALKSANAQKLPDNSQNGAWEVFMDMPNLKAFRRPMDGKSVYLYRSVANLDFAAEPMFQMFCDLGYRKEWDHTALEIEVLDSCQGNDVVYWAVQIPWPMACRDYVYYRRVKAYPEHGVFVILSRGAKLGLHKREVPGIVRVEDYVSNVVIRATSPTSVEITTTYMDDPKGVIPKFLVNFAAKQAFPKMMDSFKAAFPAYEKRWRQAQQLTSSSSVPQGDSAENSAIDSNSKQRAPPKLHNLPNGPAFTRAEDILFEYNVPWEAAVAAVLHVKRNVHQKSQRIVETNELEFSIFTQPPLIYRMFAKGIQEFEWYDQLELDQENRQLLCHGRSITLSPDLQVFEEASWFASPTAPATHTTFRGCIVFKAPLIPMSVCNQIGALLRRHALARRNSELLLARDSIQRGEPMHIQTQRNRDSGSQNTPKHAQLGAEPSDSDSNSDSTIDAEAKAFLAWARARMVQNLAVVLSQTEPRASVTFDFDNSIVQSVAISWFRCANGARESIEGSTNQQEIRLGAGEYGRSLEVEVRSKLVGGAVGPVARCCTETVWTHTPTQQSLQTFASRGEAVFHVTEAKENGNTGLSTSSSAKDSTQQLKLVLSRQAITLRSGMFGKLVEGTFGGTKAVTVTAMPADPRGVTLTCSNAGNQSKSYFLLCQDAWVALQVVLVFNQFRG